MPYGTARNRLIKQLLFDFMTANNKNNCYQCGEIILNPEDMSIEHITPWLDSDDPVKLFFDKQNIAYSHLSCNCTAARKGTDAFREWANSRKGITTGRSRIIEATCLATGTIKRLCSENEIRQHGFNESHVRAVCNGTRNTHKNHAFKYV
jgi:hypothetical protein